MLASEEVPEKIGHAVGGVCRSQSTRALRSIWMILCAALRRCSPACGSSNSAIELTLPELEHYSGALGWVHVCKDTQA